jgi:hypothetical protein
MMTNRTARGNRVGLAVTGLVLLTAGGYVLARSLGAFGSTQARQPVYTDAEAGWIRTTIWIWLAVAAVGVMIAILALRWLIVQLRTERLNRLIVDTDAGAVDVADVAVGRTDLPAGALSTAVGSEIQTYPGVRSVHAYLTGDPDQPQLNLNVTVDPDVDVPRVRRRIVDEAVAHARTALDTPDLATQLRLTVARPTRDHRNYI